MVIICDNHHSVEWMDVQTDKGIKKDPNNVTGLKVKKSFSQCNSKQSQY